jgi:hypothetical protein
MPQTMPPPVVD